MIVTTPGSVLQLLIGTAVAFCFLALQMYMSPRKRQSDDNVANATSFSLVCFFVLCIVMQYSTFAEDIGTELSKDQETKYTLGEKTFIVTML